MRPRMLGALALADFRERVRRPAYVVVLLAAVGLGYLAVPAAGDHWTIVNAGPYRGLYNSAYVGTVTALAGALWLSTGGFYVVRTAIARDRQTRVGELLAATPMPTGGYLVGKFLSNLLVLASMAGTLVITAMAMQLARGESRVVHPVALFAPFVWCTLPVIAVTAAAAIVFETTPVLRGGLGNLIWLFLSLAGAVAGQSAGAPLGGLGVAAFAQSLRDDLAAHGAKLTDLALGMMYLDEPPRAVPWNGIDFSLAFVAQRMVLIALAAGAALVPALWFDRFDRARAAAGVASRPAGGSLGSAAPRPAPGLLPVGGLPRAGNRSAALRSRPSGGLPPAGASPPIAGRSLVAETAVRARHPHAHRLSSGRRPSHPTGPLFDGEGGSTQESHIRTARMRREPAYQAANPATVYEPMAYRTTRRSGFTRVVIGELRILTGGLSRWWWLGTVVLVVTGVAVPAGVRPLLMAAWIWPVLVWSQLGCRARENGAEALLDACPGPILRTLAQWLSGVALTAMTGIGPGLALTGEGHLSDWLAGVAFIPALALALGLISRTQRSFQVLYPLLWYMVVNDVAGLDYMGVLPGGPPPLAVAATATVLLLAALAVTHLRHRLR